MKKQLLQLIMLTALLLPLALVANAYTNPSASAPNGNTDGPITIGVANQAKQGGLSVNAFEAKKPAQLGYYVGCTPQPCTDAIPKIKFDGMIRGDTIFAIGDKSVLFGDTSKAVTVAAGGNISATNVLQSDSLKASATNKLCADEDGVFVFCPPTTAPVPLTVTYRFAQPPNRSYKYDVDFYYVKTPSQTYSLGNDGHTGEQVYFTSTTQVLTPGVYRVSKIDTTCPGIDNNGNIKTGSNDSSIVVGSQFILDKKHSNPANIFSAGCGE